MVELLDKDRGAPNKEQNAKAYRSTFENVLSKPMRVGRHNGPGARVKLSLYEVHEALGGFDNPLAKAIENINEFRTHAVDDPILIHMGQITKGTPKIRQAALLLDQSIDRFAADFTRFKR